MSNDFMSESTFIEPHSPSKSVTKVQKLCNLAVWNEVTAVLKDYIRCFCSKRTAILHLKKDLTTRKRVIILTPDDILLVYETNCTGYSFDIRAALKLKTSCNGHIPGSLEKSCTVTLKYKFGSVNLVLVNSQISVWRRTLSTIFEGECFDRSLLTDLSLYTAKDEDTVEDEEEGGGGNNNHYWSNPSVFNRSDTIISLKSAHGCIDLDISPPFDYFTEDETQKLPKSSSNRSLTLLPSVTAISQAPSSTSLAQKPVNNPISIRRGSRCVFDLAKKFEERLRKKEAQKTLNEEKAASSPLEILFPPLPQIQTVRKEDLKSLKSTSEQQQVVQISKLDYTPTKKERVVVKQEVEVTLD